MARKGIPVKKAAADAPWSTLGYQFPEPEARTVGDSDRSHTAHKFFEYWHSLKDHPAVELLEARFYRTWPYTDEKLLDKNAQTTIEIIMGAMPFNDPQEYESWCREKWGCGGYKAYLNEKGVSGPMMTCLHFGNRREMHEYPPKLDIRTVVQNLKENEPYYLFCRQNGIVLPWEKPAGEENEMAGGSAIVMEALKTSNETLVEMSKERVEDAQRAAEQAAELAEARIEAAQTRGPDAETTAATRAIEMVSDTARSMVAMAKENSGKQFNAIEIIEATGKLMESRRGGGENELMRHLLDMQDKAHQREIAHMETTNRFMTQVLDKLGQVSAPPPQKTVIEQINEWKQIQEVLGIAPNRAVQHQAAPAPAPPPEKESWFNESTAPIVMAAFQTGMILLANIVHNLMTPKTGVATQSPQEAMQAAAQVTRQAQAAAGVETTADPAEAQAAKEKAGWTEFMHKLEGPFTSHFFMREAKGYTLAFFILSDGSMEGETEKGRANYNAIKTRLGKANFDLLVRGNQEIWSRVKGMPAQYQRFIDEFFTFDDYMVQVAKDRAAAASPVDTKPPADPAPVNGVAKEPTPAS